MTTLITGLVVAAGSLIGDAAEPMTDEHRDAVRVRAGCAGYVLRVTEPDRPRHFRVPRVDRRAARHPRLPLHHEGPAVAGGERFAIWLVIGAALYAGTDTGIAGFAWFEMNTEEQPAPVRR